MIKTKSGNISYYQSEQLLNYSAIEHFFSTRKSGFDELEQFSKVIGIPLSNIIIPKQTHSANIKIIDASNEDQFHTDIDALITQQAGICIAVKTADCTPVLLFDPVEKVIAAIHSGWRGTAQNIAGKTVEKLIHQFNSNPENIVAAIGPSIGQENYEVGPEVILKFHQLFPDNTSILGFTGLANGKAKLSARHAIFEQLLKAGLTQRHIEISSLCTFHNADDFYSARRDGPQTGRMINGIMLK